ncbi:hypothetical protein MP638_003455 [Amoeboaphelidium occidentale]|nr:hypothetical protein MP638_003455 [Amoeboaphelidium occidentale]
MMISYSVLILSFNLLLTALQHEKSFLLQDGASVVYDIDFYKESLLLTSSNDIVEKDIETGVIKRTFRAHTSIIKSFLVTNGSTMITSGWDDMIIVWDLETGSAVHRIWLRESNILVASIAIQDENLFAGGQDGSIRCIDLLTARVVRTLRNAIQVETLLVKEDHIYVGKQSAVFPLDKIQIATFRLVLSFEGHSESVYALYFSGGILYSGSADTTIISWNSESGKIIRTFLGHSDFVSALIVLEDTMYSSGNDRTVIEWSIDSGEIIKIFTELADGKVRCIGSKNRLLFTGLEETSVVMWNTTSGLPLFKYSGKQKMLTSVVLWKSSVINGGDDSLIRIWDATFDNTDPYKVLTDHTDTIGCLIVDGDTLFSGSGDLSIRHWNLTDLFCLKILFGHTEPVAAFALGDSSLFSGDYDGIVLRWNVSIGVSSAKYAGHADIIQSIQYVEGLVLSGSYDSTIRIWSTESNQNIKTLNTISSILSICISENHVIGGSTQGLMMFDFTSGEVVVQISDRSACYSLISSLVQVFSGHDDGSMKARDRKTLEVSGVFQGHSDIIFSLGLDEKSVLYSASFDGSCKRWNMATRKAAFSFEDRSGSVTSLSITGNILLVGTRRGIINSFDTFTALNINSLGLHTEAVTSLSVSDGQLFSSGMDGLILQSSLSYMNYTKVIYHTQNALKGLVIDVESN